MDYERLIRSAVIGGCHNGSLDFAQIDHQLMLGAFHKLRLHFLEFFDHLRP